MSFLIQSLTVIGLTPKYSAASSMPCHISINQIRKDNQIVVEWYISDDKELFHKFHSHKTEIETDMDMKLDWRELPDKKASRILI